MMSTGATMQSGQLRLGVDCTEAYIGQSHWD
jgi:hypothetical protein